MSTYRFHKLWLKNIQNKFLLASMKSLAYCEILSGTIFRKLVPAFREPPVTLKVVPKAACGPENCLKVIHECTLEKIN